MKKLLFWLVLIPYVARATPTVVIDRVVRCPPFIGEIELGAYLPARKFRCFSTARAAEKAGFSKVEKYEPEDPPRSRTPQFQGYSDAVTGVFAILRPSRIRWTHTNDSYFSIKAYNAGGKYVALLASSIDPGSGAGVITSRGNYFFVIVADANDHWTITIEDIK